MYNFGVLRQLWKTAFDSTCLTQNFGSVQPAVANRSPEIPIPNLNSDVVAIEIHGHIICSSVAGQAAVAGALLTDIIDNFDIKDPEGKSVIDLGWESFFNYCGVFNGGNVDDIDALGAIGKADTHTYDFRVIVPIYIPASQGIHKMVFDWSLANIYGGDVTLDAGSLIAYDVITNDGANLEKWKAADRAETRNTGNNSIANFEVDRNWYFVMIQNLDNGVTDIDDVTLKHLNLALVDNEYDDLEAEFLARVDEIDFVPRFAGDAGFYFRNHAHLSTDGFVIEGNTAGTMTLLLIASADASRSVTTPEVTGGNIVAQVATTPAVTMGQPASTVTQGNLTTSGNRIMPVKLNVGY